MQQKRFQLDTRKKIRPSKGGQISEQVTWPGCVISTYKDICNSTICKDWTTSLGPALSTVERNDLQRSLPT